MRYAFVGLMILGLTMFGMSVNGQETQTVVTQTGEASGTKKEAEHGMGKVNRVVANTDADGVQRVELTGGEYFFDPNYIVVKVNKPVELKVRKTPGFTPHDIVVDAADAGIKFAESLDKEPKIIKFTPTKTGKYPMYCSKKLPFVKSHRDRGMDGMIEVVE